MIDFLDQLDKTVFLFLNGFNSVFWDKVMWWVSGDTSWIFLYILILLWLAKEYKWRMLAIVLAIAIMVTLSDQTSVHMFKEVVRRLRPCHCPDISQLVHIVNDYCGGKYGFVSSHAANTFAVAMFSSGLLKNKYYTWFIFLWATFVSYSRIYLGVHYPGDITGGALLGILIGWLILTIYKVTERKLLLRFKFFNL